MINHARTLLMNRPGRNQSLVELGEEFIPDSFLAQKLPPWLQNAWAVLFGNDPDNTYRSYVADQLLRCVHATDYETYLLLHDRRITYDPKVINDLATLRYGLLGESNSAQYQNAFAIGEIEPNEIQGRIREVFSFGFSGATLTLTNHRTQQAKVADVDRTPASTTTKPLALPGMEEVSVTFELSTSTSGSWDSVGTVTVIARPRKSLVDKVVEIDNLPDFTRRLFGTKSAQPYRTFYNLWLQQACFPERLAGLVLAMVFRLNDIRLGRV